PEAVFVVESVWRAVPIAVTPCGNMARSAYPDGGNVERPVAVAGTLRVVAYGGFQVLAARRASGRKDAQAKWAVAHQRGGRREAASCAGQNPVSAAGRSTHTSSDRGIFHARAGMEAAGVVSFHAKSGPGRPDVPPAKDRLGEEPPLMKRITIGAV